MISKTYRNRSRTGSKGRQEAACRREKDRGERVHINNRRGTVMMSWRRKQKGSREGIKCRGTVNEAAGNTETRGQEVTRRQGSK